MIENQTSDKARYCAAAIANYFLWRSWEEERDITLMKLLRLVYLTYGWNLVINNGEKLFAEPIEAWECGPVVPSLYCTFSSHGNHISHKHYGNKEFCYDSSTGELEYESTPMASDSTTVRIMSVIWRTYGSSNSFQLSKITNYPGGAWDTAYKEGEKSILNDEKIKLDSIIGINYYLWHRKSHKLKTLYKRLYKRFTTFLSSKL